MVNTAGSAPSLPSYKRPPVIETSFGAVFIPLSAMQTRHFGQFWAEHRDEYPTTQDQSPLLDATDLEALRLKILAMPPLRRMMAYSGDQRYVAQVQDSRVHLNWRKVNPEDDYPRYPSVHDRFLHLWEAFQRFVEREHIGPLSVTRYELAYINHIELGSNVPAELEQHVKLYRFSPIESEYLAPPESVNSIWRFAMPGQRGTAAATLSNATNQQGQNLLVLVLTCTGAPSEKYSAHEWFESAHEWIVRSFTGLTTDEAHRKWERER
jgi:uncharacterized protein (TIGR04255 family)